MQLGLYIDMNILHEILLDTGRNLVSQDPAKDFVHL